MTIHLQSKSTAFWNKLVSDLRHSFTLYPFLVCVRFSQVSLALILCIYVGVFRANYRRLWQSANNQSNHKEGFPDFTQRQLTTTCKGGREYTFFPSDQMLQWSLGLSNGSLKYFHLTCHACTWTWSVNIWNLTKSVWTLCNCLSNEGVKSLLDYIMQKLHDWRNVIGYLLN